MKTKLIKLIQNELIKIFKRKTIYFLFFASAVLIFVYNNINPDQNKIVSYDSNTNDFVIIREEDFKTISKKYPSKNMKDKMDLYINQKTSNDFAKLYNTFEENSWQRYALKEENNKISIDNIPTDYNLDIYEYLRNINDYEYNLNSEITSKIYEESKVKYKEYIDALTSDNWKEYVNLKIQNLEARKESKKISDPEIDEINFEIKLSLKLSYIKYD